MSPLSQSNWAGGQTDILKTLLDVYLLSSNFATLIFNRKISATGASTVMYIQSLRLWRGDSVYHPDVGWLRCLSWLIGMRRPDDRMGKGTDSHVFFCILSGKGSAGQHMVQKMKRAVQSLIATMLLLISTCGCNSYSYNIFGSISGTITDSESGQPIPAAAITIVPGSATQQTSYDGRFSFTGLEEGQYTVSVQKSGYQANRKNVTVVSDETTETIIQLSAIPQ